jgi:GT2 family glycosyltransferase
LAIASPRVPADMVTVPLTVAIPTYRREQVLIDTISYLLELPQRAAEILVLDQTEKHEEETQAALSRLAQEGTIRWIRLDRPSIPAAMNRGLLQAAQPIVLFVDDDVRPEPQLLTAHLLAHDSNADGLVAGRVIQPWQEGVELRDDTPFHFATAKPSMVPEFIGCNFSVRRDVALKLGGFDENFVRVAYRYEAEFAHRYRSAGRKISFEPHACVHHLKVGAGGTRTYGDHLTTWRPDHAVGAYYHGLRTGTPGEFFRRPIAAVATRHHLRHPWRIPGTLLAELGGMLWAAALYLRGPRYLKNVSSESLA